MAYTVSIQKTINRYAVLTGCEKQSVINMLNLGKLTVKDIQDLNKEKVQQYAEANGVTINHVYKLINYGRIKL